MACALHAVLDCLSKLWRPCRAKAGTRRNFFDQFCFFTESVNFPDWAGLLETTPGRRRLVAIPT